MYIKRASLVAQLIKNPPAMQETWFNSWVGKIPWRKVRPPIPVFLGFPGGSTGKESACNEGDLGWDDPLEKERPPTPVFWPGEFHGLCSLRDLHLLTLNSQSIPLPTQFPLRTASLFSMSVSLLRFHR